MPGCLYVHHVYASAPGILLTGSCVPPCGCWEQNLDTLSQTVSQAFNVIEIQTMHSYLWTSIKNPTVYMEIILMFIKRFIFFVVLLSRIFLHSPGCCETYQTRLSLNSQRSTCFCHLMLGIEACPACPAQHLHLLNLYTVSPAHKLRFNLKKVCVESKALKLKEYRKINKRLILTNFKTDYKTQ